MSKSSSELAWDWLVTTADRLTGEYGDPVKATTRFRWRSATRGFKACGRFFPVYQRPLLGSDWSEICAIQDAASDVGKLLRENRPGTLRS